MELSRAAGILFIVLPGVQWVGGSEPSFLGEPIMPILVEAIYDGGVLRPVDPLPLQEHAKVRLTIEVPSDWVRETAGILKWTGTPEELQRFAEDPEFDYPPAPGEP